MKASTKTIWGVVLILAGILFILNTAGVIPYINLFFKGWWTLFIIIPCLIGMFTSQEKGGPFMGLAIGVLLLLATRDIIEWEDFGRYALGVLIIVIGYSLICGKKNAASSRKENVSKITQDGKDIQNYNYNFGKYTEDFSGRRFEGADVKVSFGSFTLDLRNAVIEQDVMILLDCNFGNVVILVPGTTAVHIGANATFGEIKDTRRYVSPAGGPAIHLVGNVTFGGAEIR